jgi:hypothetical protein
LLVLRPLTAVLGPMEMPKSGAQRHEDARSIRKTQSHGRIGEAAATAKCWMHGIAAYNTGGLRANFAGSDLIIDTSNPKVKRLVQVKSGYSPKNRVYLTQCTGDADLSEDRFACDFVIFVNIEQKVGSAHKHDGALGFEHLTFYVVPRERANSLYQAAVRREFARPLRKGGTRKLGNLAVYVTTEEMEPYRDAWHLLRSQRDCEHP